MARASKKMKPKPKAWSLERALAELGPRPDAAAERLAWQRRYDDITARDRNEQDLRRRQARNAVAKRVTEEYRPVAGFQEVHSPTEEFRVRGDVRVTPDGKVSREEIGQTRRRRIHAILMNLLSEEQKQAIEEIDVALQMMPGVGRIRSQVFERQSRTTSGGPEAEAMKKLQLAYFGWARRLQEIGISHAVAYDIIFEGKGLTVVDKERGKHFGYAKQHLIAALDMWTIERGWRRHFTPAIQTFADKVRVARTVYEATKQEGDDMGADVRGPGTDGGRTFEMVSALPATGSMVVVFSEQHAGFVGDMIAGIRGAKVRSATRVEAIADVDRVVVLRSIRMPTFVDASFWTFAKVPVAFAVASEVKRVNGEQGINDPVPAIDRAIRVGQFDVFASRARVIFSECCRHGRVDDGRVADVVEVRQISLSVGAPDPERTLMRQICKAVIPEGWRWAFAETLAGPPLPVLLEADVP